jgi:hypothetical protein
LAHLLPHGRVVPAKQEKEIYQPARAVGKTGSWADTVVACASDVVKGNRFLLITSGFTHAAERCLSLCTPCPPWGVFRQLSSPQRARRTRRNQKRLTLLRLAGGAEGVQSYLNELKIHEMVVANTEKEIGRDWQTQYRNWATPEAAVTLLRALHERRGLSEQSQSLLLRVLTESTPGAKRLKGLLSAGTIVAHKTGTSGTENGVTATTNDIGIITLPNGRHLAIAVFVSDSPEDEKTREAVIARDRQSYLGHLVQAGLNLWAPVSVFSVVSKAKKHSPRRTRGDTEEHNQGVFVPGRWPSGDSGSGGCDQGNAGVRGGEFSDCGFERDNWPQMEHG